MGGTRVQARKVRVGENTRGVWSETGPTSRRSNAMSRCSKERLQPTLRL